MSETKELNFAVLKSGFGDYWVGKVKLESNGKSVFPTFEEATNRALALTDSIENTDELEAVEEAEVEELRPEMEKWIIS